MVSKKELISELQKYNKDLEKYVSHVDTKYIDKLSLDKKVQEKEEENFSLLASSIMDLRTEVALSRKNLAGDTERILTKLVEEQHERSVEQIKKVYNKIIYEIKENFSSYVITLSEKFSTLENEVREMEGKIDTLKDNIKNTREEVSEIIIKLDKTDHATELSLKNIKRNFANEIANLKGKVERIDEDVDNLDLIAKTNRKLLEKENDELKSLGNMVGENKIGIPYEEINKGKIDVPIEIPRVHKMLAIDEKIKKLESLR